jgi:hypothetical protein
MVPKMSVIFNQLKWLIAQEDFIHIFISVVLSTLVTIFNLNELAHLISYVYYLRMFVIIFIF